MIEEGWVKFRRVYCKEGFIDIWRGDSINNPNKSSKHSMQLNSTTEYYRLCGQEKWYNKRDFKQSLISDLTLYGPMFSAKEIWYNLFIDEEKEE